MTEEQVRDLLARVVPEPPDSVTDPAPVVRAARRRRRVVTAVVGGAAVLAVAGVVLGVQTLREDEGPDVVGEPAQIADPYTTARCPDPTMPWEVSSVDDLDQVTAVRDCARPSDLGFPLIEGPADALVTGIPRFAEDVRGLPDADPSRCAAVDPIPLDNRLLLQLADGAVIGVRTGMCDDVEVEGRKVSGDDVQRLFIAAVRGQRDEHEYTAPDLPLPADCNTGATTPAAPATEHLVWATYCESADGSPEDLGAEALTRLDDAWRNPVTEVDLCDDPLGGSGARILARTDRGDLVTFVDTGCELSVQVFGDPPADLYVPVTVDDLVAD